MKERRGSIPAAGPRDVTRPGVETWWAASGRKEWERNHTGDTWTWKIFDAAGRVTAESRWRGKDLLDANPEGPLAR